MNDAIRQYLKAEIRLKAAEQALDDAVQPYFTKAINDQERIMRIIHLMPKNYGGKRRMYEQIHRLN